MPGYKNTRSGFVSKFIPMKGDDPREIVRKVVTLVAAVVFIVAVTILISILAQQIKARHDIDEQRKQHDISVITQAVTTTVPTETETEVTETEPPPLVMLATMESFVEQNPDTAGWITVPNTNIDNVVLHRPNDDNNDYYLDRDFYGNKNISGQIYIDFRCIINDYDKNQTDNVIIYGHNQADQSMFGTLKKYKIKKENTKNFDFYLQNPTFSFNSLYDEYTYKIIAMFVIEAEPSQTRDGILFDYHNFVNFTKKRPFDTFSEKIMERTAVNTGVDFNKNDKYITLSTCSNEFEPSRFVVIGRRVRDGESPEVDTSLAEINTDMLEPDYSFIYGR